MVGCSDVCVLDSVFVDDFGGVLLYTWFVCVVARFQPGFRGFDALLACLFSVGVSLCWRFGWRFRWLFDSCFGLGVLLRLLVWLMVVLRLQAAAAIPRKLSCPVLSSPYHMTGYALVEHPLLPSLPPCCLSLCLCCLSVCLSVLCAVCPSNSIVFTFFCGRNGTLMTSAWWSATAASCGCTTPATGA